MALLDDAPDPSTRVVAIIPARGGSRGAPLDDLEVVGGLPLVVRTVRCALAARSVGAVYVATDDTEVARVAGTAGAVVLDGPPDDVGPDAFAEAAVLHALHGVEAREGAEPEITVLLQCTAPFTCPEHIDQAVGALRDGRADMAFTASRSHRFAWRVDADAAAVGVDHDPATRSRRPERPPEYVENGAVYALRTAGFRAAGHRFFGRIVLSEMPAVRSLEIVDDEDLAVARHLVGWLDRRHSDTRLAGIRALVFDFDGVLTDNGVITHQDGSEAVRSDRSDGLGIEMLRNAGVPMVVMSKEQNPVVSARCRKLSLDVVQGCDDKAAALERWLADTGIAAAETGFVGNDVNDLACMELVGCAIAQPWSAASTRVSCADVEPLFSSCSRAAAARRVRSSGSRRTRSMR